MAAGFPTLSDDGWIGVPWAEYIGKSVEGTSDAAFGYDDGNQVTMTILVNFGDLQDAIKGLLGTNIWNGTSGKLERVLPAAHPQLRNLVCSRITGCKPLKWLSKGKTVSSYSKYQFYRLTLLFHQPKYNNLGDADLDQFFPPVAGVRQEHQRFLEYSPQPASLTLTRDAGTFVWAEGDGAGGRPTAGLALTTSVAQQLAQLDMIYTWRRVPFWGLVSPTTYRPDKLLNILNNVNNASFLGFTKGTLLFKSARFTVKEAPLNYMVLSNPKIWQPALVADVEINMGYFNPPYGGSANPANAGWVLSPFSDLKWYLIHDKGTNTSTIFPYGDFTSIFTYSA